MTGIEGFVEEGLRIEDGKADVLRLVLELRAELTEVRAGIPLLELKLLVVTGLTGVEDEAGTFGTGTTGIGALDDGTAGTGTLEL